MDREEFIAKLQMVYVGDRNAFNEIVGVYDNLKEENQRLNNFLNELEKWLYIKIEISSKQEYLGFYTMILDKVIELKESDK